MNDVFETTPTVSMSRRRLMGQVVLGGAAALTSSAVQAGIPPTAIPDTVRTNLLVRLISAQLAPGAADADAVGAGSGKRVEALGMHGVRLSIKP